MMGLELAVRDIIDIREKSIDMEAFGGWTLSKVMMLFPTVIQTDFVLLTGDGKERLIKLGETRLRSFGRFGKDCRKWRS